MYSRNPLPTLKLRTEFWLLTQYFEQNQVLGMGLDWNSSQLWISKFKKSHYRLREQYSRSFTRGSVEALAPTLVTSMQHLVLGHFPICGVDVSDNTNNKNVSFDEYPEITETSGQPVAMMPEAKYCLCYAQTLIMLCNCHQM